MGTVFYNRAEELATVSTVFRVGDTPTDPGTVTFVVTDPDGTPATYETGDLVHGGPGEYSLEVSCASATAGVWTAVLVGTSAAADVDVVTWTTFDTDLTCLYCTPAELKSRTGIEQDDKLDDVEILGACMAAKTGIDLHCGRVFSRSAGTRVFDANEYGELSGLDLVSVTALLTDDDGDGVFETTWSEGTDFQLLDVGAAWKPGGPWPYTSVRPLGGRRFPISGDGDRLGRIQIEGVHQWPRVPPNVKQASAIITSDLLKLGTMAFGVAGYGEYGAVRARENPIVSGLLGPYRRAPLDA